MNNEHGLTRREFMVASAAGAALLATPGDASAATVTRIVRRIGDPVYIQIWLNGTERSLAAVAESIAYAAAFAGDSALERVGSMGGESEGAYFPESFMLAAMYTDGPQFVVTTLGDADAWLTIRGTRESLVFTADQAKALEALQHDGVVRARSERLAEIALRALRQDGPVYL